MSTAPSSSLLPQTPFRIPNRPAPKPPTTPSPSSSGTSFGDCYTPSPIVSSPVITIASKHPFHKKEKCICQTFAPSRCYPPFPQPLGLGITTPTYSDEEEEDYLPSYKLKPSPTLPSPSTTYNYIAPWLDAFPPRAHSPTLLDANQRPPKPPTTQEYLQYRASMYNRLSQLLSTDESQQTLVDLKQKKDEEQLARSRKIKQLRRSQAVYWSEDEEKVESGEQLGFDFKMLSLHSHVE